MTMTGVRLNLGCSDQLLPGYINCDLVKPCDVIVDLSCRWPWPDSSVDEIRAHDIFEHLPSKIHTMNEAWRVLKLGGRLDLKVPTTAGFGAFQDPTHQSWWTPNDLFYYSVDPGFYTQVDAMGFDDRFSWNGAERRRFGTAYGIVADFRVVEATHRLFGANVWYLMAQLEAVK